MLYKIFRPAEWRSLQAAGRSAGGADDLASGFVHLSTAEQLPGTAAKHFAGEDGLILAEVPAAALGADLVWEPSRGGALFPHLYRPLGRDEITRHWPLRRGPDGRHDLWPEG